MTPFEVYQAFTALRLHFTKDNYDYFRYNGKTKVASVDAYQKRKDKYLFEKLAKQLDPFGILVANFVKNPNVYIRNIDSTLQLEQSLTYNFTQDLKHLNTDFNENFKINEHLPSKYPLILTSYLSGDIRLESVIILTSLTDCIRYWDKHLQWSPLRKTITKYSGFVKFDKDKFKQIIVDKFNRNPLPNDK